MSHVYSDCLKAFGHYETVNEMGKRVSQNIPMSSVAMSAQASVKRKRLVEVLMEMFLKMTMQTMELPSVPVMPIST